MAINSLSLGIAFTARDLASGAIGGLKTRLDELRGSSEEAAVKVDASFKLMKSGAIQLGVGLVGLRAIKGLSKSFQDFEVGLVTAGTVMRATSSEMRSLKDAAIQAGIATQFSPTEAIQGLQNLGAAGLKAKDAVEVLNPVLALASASLGQIGVAEAAANVIGVMNAFGESASNAAKRVDQLVRITQLSNFQARDFKVAISQAAAAAKGANQTFESMTATLGLLRNTNLDASSAATAYREAVRRLSGSTQALNALTKLGITPQDKITGKIKDLGQIITEVAPKLLEMGGVQRGLALNQIFGARGAKVFNAFMAGYNKLLAEGKIRQGDFAAAQTRLIEGLNKSPGAAKAASDAFLRTAAGQQVLLKGSIETFKVLVGETLTPILIPAVKGAISVLNKLIGIFRAIPTPIKDALATFAGLASLALAASGSIKLLVGAFGLLKIGAAASGIGGLAGAFGGAGKSAGLLGRSLGFLGRNLGLIGIGVALATTTFITFRDSLTGSGKAAKEFQAELDKDFAKQDKQIAKREAKLAGVRSSQKQAQTAFLDTERQAKRAARAAAEAAGKRLEESRASKKQAKRTLIDLQTTLVQRTLAAKEATTKLADVENELAKTSIKGVQRQELLRQKIKLQNTIETARRIVNVTKFAELQARGIAAETAFRRERDEGKRAQLAKVAAAGRVAQIRDIDVQIAKEQKVRTAAQNTKSLALVASQDKKIAALRAKQAKARGVVARLFGIEKGDEQAVTRLLDRVTAPEFRKLAQIDVGLQAKAITAIKTEVIAPGATAREIEESLRLARAGKIQVPTAVGGRRAVSPEFISRLVSESIQRAVPTQARIERGQVSGVQPVPGFGGFGAPAPGAAPPQRLTVNIDGKRLIEILMGGLKTEMIEAGGVSVPILLPSTVTAGGS